MVRVVLIDEATATAKQEVGDKVSVYEDGADLSGFGYKGFKILDIPGVTVAQVNAIFAKKRPEISMAFYASTGGKWTFDRPQEKMVWKNPSSGKWCFLEEEPKHEVTFKNLTDSDIEALSSKEVSVSEKQAILDKVVDKISLQEENLVEVEDLNTATEIKS